MVSKGFLRSDLDRIASSTHMPTVVRGASAIDLVGHEIMMYLRTAMSRPRSSPAKVAAGVAVFEVRHLLMEGRLDTVTAQLATSIAALGIVTARDSSYPEADREPVALARDQISKHLASSPGWSAVWTQASELGRATGFSLVEEAPRANRLWASIFALTDAGDDVVLPPLTAEALPRLDLVVDRLRATDASVFSPLATTSTRGWVGAWPAKDAVVAEIPDLLPGGDDYSKPPPGTTYRLESALFQPTTSPHARRVLVWFGTNRAPSSSVTSSSFTNALDVGALHYGACQVNLPTRDESSVPGWDFISAWTRFGLPIGPARVERLVRFTSAKEFTAAIQSRDTTTAEERAGLLFIHGYATSFAQAAVAAATLSDSIKHRGPTAMFSWPSNGNKLRYRHDERVIDESRDALRNFCRTLTGASGLERVDVVVHSLGNRLFLRTLSDWLHRFGPAWAPIRNVYLAAPDVASAEFPAHAGDLRIATTKSTLYSSNSDSALLVSKIFHSGEERVGLTPPVFTGHAIDSIETSGVDSSRLRHTYVINAPAVRADIHQTQAGYTDPSARSNVHPAGSMQVPDFWRMS